MTLTKTQLSEWEYGVSGEIVADRAAAPIARVIVVGGGSAGWITAGLLAAEHAEVSISLIESPNVPIIGVGEGTWPSMRRTLQRLGLSEAEFVRDCDAVQQFLHSHPHPRIRKLAKPSFVPPNERQPEYSDEEEDAKEAT